MSEPPWITQTASGSYNAQAAAGATAVVNVYSLVSPRPVDTVVLAEAEQLLASMPTERVSEPAPLPIGSRMTLRHNPLFVGRGDELRALGAALTSGKAAAVTGLGGIGKTQLASEFVHRNGQYFAGGVFWLSFFDENAVLSEIASCGGVGFLDVRPDFAGLSLEDKVRAVIAAWGSPMPRLLVFDNCEAPELLDQWKPPTGGCRVLITSRRSSWPPTLGVQPIPLPVLTREQSVMLLQRHLQDPAVDVKDLAAIAFELGDLPLALHLAGSVLLQYRDVITPAVYLQRIRDPALLEAPWLRSKEISPTGHVQHIAVTFALSYEQLEATDSTDNLALSLLARAAHLAPGEPIPRNLLLATAELPNDGPESLLEAEDALIRLVALGLLERGTTGTLRLHRLLAIFVRRRVADEGAQAAVERALLRIGTERSGDASLSSLLAIQPHLRWAAEAASDRGDLHAAHLHMVLGDHLMRLGDYLGAKSDYSRALSIHQERLGKDHLDTVASMHGVGLAHKERGEYAEAQRYFEQALASTRRARGDRDLLTAAGLGTLAFVLKDRGRYAEAQGYFAEALKITRALRGEGAETAVCLNNLGLVHKDQREYATAESYFARALDMTQAVHDESGMVASLNNLAFLLKDQGQHDQARRYFQQALAINVATRGWEHLDTITSLNNVAFVLVDQAVAAWQAGGQQQPDKLFAQARNYLEQALAIQERILPDSHPRRAEGLESLGEVLDRGGDHKGAQRFLERALAIRLQVLGEWHVETARNLSSLGKVLAAQENDMSNPAHLIQARSYLEQSVAAFEHSLGPSHESPDAARARAMLENVKAQLESHNNRLSAHMSASLR